MAIAEIIDQGVNGMTQVEAEFGIASRILGQQYIQYFISLGLIILFSNKKNNLEQIDAKYAKEKEPKK